MGRFERAESSESTPTLSAVERIANWCCEWMERNQLRAMPEPLPANPGDAARWWLSTIYRERESDADKAIYGLSALHGFLRLNRWQREQVVTLSRWTRYRGDSWDLYKRVCEEHDLYREDPEKYRDTCAARMKATMARQTVGLDKARTGA